MISVRAPAWIVAFERAVRAQGAPTRSLVAGLGRLRIELGERDPADLVAVIRPLASQTDGWGKTRRFVLAYEGEGDPSARGQRWLGAVLRALRRTETHLPSDLAEPAGLFVDAAPEELRFAALYPFAAVERSRIGELEAVEVLVRTTSRCNQACPFCSAPAPHEEASLEALVSCFDAVAEIFPSALVTLTGGEPTLRDTFQSAVEQALRRPAIGQVQVQTNAVAFAERLDPSVFAPSKRLAFFVSLHALDDPTYDRITQTRGQLPRAIRGLARLLEAGHEVVVNCVVQRENVADLDRYVRELPARLPWNGRTELHFSTLICSECRPAAAEWLVPLSELARQLEVAVRVAAELGLRTTSLRSSTHASLPACVLGEADRDARAHRPHPLPHETGLLGEGRSWTRAATCRSCRECDFCLGVPSAYASRFGLGELVPLPPR